MTSDAISSRSMAMTVTAIRAEAPVGAPFAPVGAAAVAAGGAAASTPGVPAASTSPGAGRSGRGEPIAIAK